MKYTIHTQHCDFYKEHHAVEFEEVLSPQEVQALNQAIDEALAVRLSTTAANLKKKPIRALYDQGRDLWRTSPQVKKVVCGTKLAQIAYELMQVKPLRLAFDQWVPKQALVNSDRPFKETCSIQGFQCGVLLWLSGEKAGSALYFSPDYTLQFPEESSERMLMVGYANQISLYIHQDQDPHKNALKQLGYSYGDRLNDKLHPLIHNLKG